MTGTSKTLAEQPAGPGEIMTPTQRQALEQALEALDTLLWWAVKANLEASGRHASSPGRAASRAASRAEAGAKALRY